MANAAENRNAPLTRVAFPPSYLPRETEAINIHRTNEVHFKDDFAFIRIEYVFRKLAGHRQAAFSFQVIAAVARERN